MSRFPVLTTVGYILRGAAILCGIGGLIALFGKSYLGFVAAIGFGLTLWVYAEVTGVVLSIEDNTYETKQALRTLAQAIERGALMSSASPAPTARPISAPPRPGWEAAASAAPRPAPAPAARPSARADWQPARSTTPFLNGHVTSLTEIPIASASQSPDSASAALACDKNLDTIWATEGEVPQTSAFAVFDLNMVRRIGEIAWQFSVPPMGTSLRIETAMRQEGWETLLTPGDAPADAWQSLTCDVSARYVRFYFENPNHLPSLGHLREVQIFAKA
jgi:hypothetical protein